MKIKCIAETIKPQNHNEKIVEWVKKSELEITKGKVYVVLAISKYLDTLFYYILGDESENYPLAFPSELFEIISNRISEYWDTDLEQIIALEDIKIENNVIEYLYINYIYRLVEL